MYGLKDYRGHLLYQFIFTLIVFVCIYIIIAVNILYNSHVTKSFYLFIALQCRRFLLKIDSLYFVNISLTNKFRLFN